MVKKTLAFFLIFPILYFLFGCTKQQLDSNQPVKNLLIKIAGVEKEIEVTEEVNQEILKILKGTTLYGKNPPTVAALGWMPGEINQALKEHDYAKITLAKEIVVNGKKVNCDFMLVFLDDFEQNVIFFFNNTEKSLEQPAASDFDYFNRDFFISVYNK